MTQTRKPILCLDFDGVIHDYKRGWQNGEIYGDVTPGFWEWASEAKKHFTLVVYSSRSKENGGRHAMWAFMKHEWGRWMHGDRKPETMPADPVSYMDFEFAHEKPPAFLTIDDRCVRFDGLWQGTLRPDLLLSYKPWNVS